MKLLSSDDISKSVDNLHDGKSGRIFGYSLSNKRAKKKLLKGASEASDLHMEIKSGCTNMRF